MTTTRKHTGHRHTGYVVTSDEGLLLATVTESRRPNGGYTVRRYTGPDEYTITTTQSLLDARDLAERHAIRFA